MADKLRQTITAIIEEFFEVNGNEVMLYITETGDGKQMFRNRLFVRWFNMYNQHDKYIIRTAEGKMDGEDNFMAIFVRKDNPHSQYVIEVFELVTSILLDKPAET